jgi:uncharacterized protein with NAD-binding domain and iron-sulfur cluster
MVNDECESIRSDKITIGELKNKRYIAKLNYSRQEKEHQFLREERLRENADAAVVHKHAQEAKQAEVLVNEARAKLVEAESVKLRLQIELEKLKLIKGGADACE